MGLQFLFAAAFWALPLAGLPLVLHLLFRRKSPVMPFSTLRFIQSSIQQTAARRNLHRWLLLACRMLLIALLIWALAQPARRATAGLLRGGSSLAAAVVVDTSYSMMLRDGQTTLLQQADADVQDLLRTELRDADVAIFRDANSAGPPRLAAAENYRGEHWAPLTPTPSTAPLVERVAAAADLLAASLADRKWLVILSDDQSREFPRPLPRLADIHTLLIDLHPADARAAAITAVHAQPRQPRLGIPAEIAVDLTGRAGDGREVKLEITPAGQSAGITAPPPLPLARFDAAGRAQLRAGLNFSDSSWLSVTARLTGAESLPWAMERTELVRVRPRQYAAVLSVGRPNPLTMRIVRLALDPSEGQRPDWPVNVRQGEPAWNESLIVAVINQWPDAAMARRLESFARSGGSLVLFVQPGLESSWPSLDQPLQDVLARLLPSPPKADIAKADITAADVAYHASIVRPADPVLADIGDPRAAEGRLTITRLIRFTAADSTVEPIINATPVDPDSGAALAGLLWRKVVGRGLVYTWAALPDRTSGNLRVWDVFPPTLVNAALPPPDQEAAINVEIGQPLTMPASLAPGGAEVDVLVPPDQKPVKVAPSGDKYVFGSTALPGLYAWRWRRENGQTGLIGWANVQLPAAEAALHYRTLHELVPDGADIVTAHSLAEARQKVVALSEPRPRWTGPIAIVLVLLCLEGLLGALPRGGRLPWQRR